MKVEISPKTAGRKTNRPARIRKESTEDTSMTDNELVQGLKKHSESAIEEIIERYTAYVSTIIYNLSKGLLPTSDIEEATADLFITLWKEPEKIYEDSLKGYIAAVAKNKARETIRRVKPKGDVLDIDDVVMADEYSLSDNIDNQVLQKDLNDALDQFGQPDREIVIRYYYYYQTAPSIAEKMGLKLEAVKSKIKRARTKLKSFLTERGY